MLKRVGVDLPVIGGLSHVYRRIQLVFKGCAGACQDHLVSLDNEFTDVTLALEDGQLVEAHKVILAGCTSSFGCQILSCLLCTPGSHIRQVSQRQGNYKT